MRLYIICPQRATTGGPEALHQLHHYTTKIGIESFLVYYDSKNINSATPKRYEKYVHKSCLLSEVNDCDDSIILVPETLTQYLKLFKKSKKIIWWLSVDNFIPYQHKINMYKKTINLLKNFKIKDLFIHLKVMNSVYNFTSDVFNYAASYYAYNYLKSNNVLNNELLIEPISMEFLQYKSNYDYKERKNIVLYNPRKGLNFTLKLIENLPFVEFIALDNYSPNELIDLYQTSKVYIDFGNFPGAERIPKEAVLFGCIIITGSYGAANNPYDVPINGEYKFSEFKVSEISGLILDSFEHYEKRIKDFNNYKNKVLNLEMDFMKKLESIFGVKDE